MYNRNRTKTYKMTKEINKGNINVIDNMILLIIEHKTITKLFFSFSPASCEKNTCINL